MSWWTQFRDNPLNWIDPVTGSLNTTTGWNVGGEQPDGPAPQGQTPYSNESGWLPGGQDAWARDHRINPTTGALEGPTSVVPWLYAREFQGQHDRIVWQRRQQLAGDALNFQQGAMGLLQSYRPGGSAAIESGIYNNMAQTQLTRAQLLQPMDFLGDLRRHEGAQAASRANRAQERQLAVQIGSAVAQAAVSYFAPGAAPFVGAALGAAGSAIAQPNTPAGAPPSYSTPAPGGQLQTQGAAPAPGGPPTGGGAPGGPAPGPQNGPPPGPTAGATLGGGEDGNLDPSQPQVDDQTQGGQAPGQGTPISGGGSPMPGGGQPPGGGAMPMMGGAAGIDGDFTDVGFGRNAAAATSGIPGRDMVATTMNNYLADMYEEDSFYQTLPFALEVRWRQRLGVAV